MATFKIDLPKGKEDPTKQSVNLTGEPVKHKEENKDKNIKEDNKTELPEVSNLRDKNEDIEKKEKVVVMDGPLSTIYTKALNIIYNKDYSQPVSQESQAIDHAITTTIVNLIVANSEDARNRNLSPSGYVYATSDQNVTKDYNGNLNGLSNIIQSRNKEMIENGLKENSLPVYVSVESDKTISLNSLNFIKYATNNNCNVVYDKSSCVTDVLDNLIKGKTNGN